MAREHQGFVVLQVRAVVQNANGQHQNITKAANTSGGRFIEN